MALTRAQVEVILIARTGKWLAAAALDGSTVNGANSALNDPIGYAVRQIGFNVADVTAVNDGDVAQVAPGDYDKLFDLAELRALENALGNYDAVDLQVGPRRESFGQLLNQLQKRVTDRRAYITSKYGLGADQLQAGVIGLDFEQKSDVPSNILLAN